MANYKLGFKINILSLPGLQLAEIQFQRFFFGKLKHFSKWILKS
jgi:hypothetical protein